jgi:hypothetical protein
MLPFDLNNLISGRRFQAAGNRFLEKQEFKKARTKFKTILGFTGLGNDPRLLDDPLGPAVKVSLPTPLQQCVSTSTLTPPPPPPSPLPPHSGANQHRHCQN